MTLHPIPSENTLIYAENVVLFFISVLSPVGDHILKEFNTPYLARFKIYKIGRP
jgi:hypothetical protein